MSYQTKINGLNYYAYYEPLYNQDGSIAGMVFVGIPSNDINEFITTEITKIVITTRERFLDVQRGIRSSCEDIGQVSAETKNCNEHRVQIVDLIQNLSAVSEENAASTQETTASMQELNATRNLLAQSSQEPLKLADQLDEETAYFTVD